MRRTLYSQDHLETNNAVIQRRGDHINDNLRRFVVGDGIDLLPFRRFIWHGRLLVDQHNKITYTITSQATLRSIPKKKGREKPHFLQSILAIENGDLRGKAEQLTLFPIETFESDVLEDDYNTIIEGLLDPSEGYRHYVVSYKADRDELIDVNVEFLDKRFNLIDRISLNEYIKPDFARLTATGTDSESISTPPNEEAHGLVTLKACVRSKLREDEKDA